jgi:hypothetical protein
MTRLQVVLCRIRCIHSALDRRLSVHMAGSEVAGDRCHGAGPRGHLLCWCRHLRCVLWILAFQTALDPHLPGIICCQRFIWKGGGALLPWLKGEVVGVVVRRLPEPGDRGAVCPMDCHGSLAAARARASCAELPGALQVPSLACTASWPALSSLLFVGLHASLWWSAGGVIEWRQMP